MIGLRPTDQNDKVPADLLVTFNYPLSRWERPDGEAVPRERVAFGKYVDNKNAVHMFTGTGETTRSYVVDRVPFRDQRHLWSQWDEKGGATPIRGFMREHEAKGRPYASSCYVEYTRYFSGWKVSMWGTGQIVNFRTADSPIMKLSDDDMKRLITPEWAYDQWKRLLGDSQSVHEIPNADALVGKIWRVR